MSDPIKVADVSELKPGECKVVTAGERELALANVDGTFYCVDNICPHQGGPLGEGILEGQQIVCPWHGWRFDVTNGKSSVIPGMQVDAPPCVVDGNEIKVTLDGN